MMRRLAGMMALVAAALLGACKDGGTNVDCPDLPRPVVIVRVLDASSGNPSAEDASGSIAEGTFTAELVPYGADRLAPRVFDRPGTYTVRVQKSGFQEWVRTGVQVAADECGAETVQLEAFLVPG